MRTEDLLLAWDPLGYGPGSYGPEFDEVMLALTYIDTVDELNHLIRRTLFDAFGECPTEEDTLEMAQRLLVAPSCPL